MRSRHVKNSPGDQRSAFRGNLGGLPSDRRHWNAKRNDGAHLPDNKGSKASACMPHGRVDCRKSGYRVGSELEDGTGSLGQILRSF